MDEKDEIIRLKQELALLKEKLKISQSLIKIGFWELDRIDKKIFLSNEAKKILRVSLPQSSITIEEFAQIVGEDQRLGLYEKVKNIENELHDLVFEFILKPTTTDNEVWIKVIANTSVHSKKNPDTIIGIVQDISEQKKSEKLLKLAKERAEEADILKSAFLANMSHEIRTPLNAILGFSQLLTNPDIANKQRNDYSEYITSSANNLLNLIRDIIDVSKIEAGKIAIQKSQCSINKILKELKFTFEKEKESQSKNHIEIILKEAVLNNDFSIITDPFRFHQIMVNLIGNALKFVEKGFIEFGYLIINNDWLQFYVKDTGIGIPNDKIDLIFSRFGQIVNKKIKNPGGTGLGLSITKHLVERLGGKIWVESEQGTGTTFYFTLPFVSSEESGVKFIKFDKDFESLNLEDIKILAVEDDQINMILLEDTLRLHIKNVTIVKAYNGLEAIDKLKEHDFDLIIMDVRMPYMDGYEATSRIRHELSHPKSQTPILGLSAHALKEEIEKGKQLGMNDFLSKPIIPEDLLLKIKKLITGNEGQLSKSNKANIGISTVLESPLLNLIFLEKIFKRDVEKIKKTLRVYLEQIPLQLKLVEDACKNNQADTMKTLSHSLKSTFKYLGRNDLSEYAREIELELNPTNEKEIIFERLKTLNEEWLMIVKAIINQFPGLKID